MLDLQNNNNSDSENISNFDPLSSFGKSSKATASLSPFSVIGDFNKDNLDQLTAAVTNVSTNWQALTNAAQDFANNLGIGNARAAEIKSTIAETTPELLGLGLTTLEAFKAVNDAPEKLGTNTIFAKETIIDLGAAAKVTGLDASALAVSFKNVGFAISEVGEKMAEVANYARGVGVNVETVTKAVSTNLKNLNLFNFENGVEGLAKMASSATMLGYEMDSVIKVAEELLKPEKAIDFSAALQRLGVTSTELLDPLSAMDLAMNNPERLATEIEKVAKQFTQLKADGSGFEIMPGAKLQLREIAAAMDIPIDKLTTMAVRGADLDMKMQQIRFPSFAASEEDRMLIANMSQMKDGRAVVQIKDEEGDLKEYDVEDLTAQQLEELKKDQADQNKTIEELALDQLTVQRKIEANTSKGLANVKFAAAEVGPLDRYMKLIQGARLGLVEEIFGNVDQEKLKGKLENIFEPLEDGIVGFVENPGVQSFTDMTLKAGESLGGIANGLKNIFDYAGNGIVAFANKAKVVAKEIYGDKENVTIGDFNQLPVSIATTEEQQQPDAQNVNQINTNNTNVQNNSNLNVNQKIELLVKTDGTINSELLAEYLKNDELKDALIAKLNEDPELRNALVSYIANSDPNNQ